MRMPRLLFASYAKFVPDFGISTPTAAQRAGISFEKAVQKKLAFLYPRVEPGPWLYYKTEKTANVCQPDALVWLAENKVCIVECKLTWQAAARSKLLSLYGPVVQLVYPQVEVCYLQVYKNAKPGAHKRPLSLYGLDNLKTGKYKECQWIGL